MTNYNKITYNQLKSLGPGKYYDGQGLFIRKDSLHSGRWVVRLVINGKRREMGLGSWPGISLSNARNAAEDARLAVWRGIDPIEERKKSKLRISKLSVKEAIESCFEARKYGLKEQGKAGRWMSPLKTLIIPKIGSIPIEEIDQHVLKEVLASVWHSKPDAAVKSLAANEFDNPTLCCI